VTVARSHVMAAQSFAMGATTRDSRDATAKAPGMLHVRDSEVRHELPTDTAAFDINGASLELERSTVSVRARIALSAENDATVVIRKSILRPISPDDVRNRKVGAGIVINGKSTLQIEDSVLNRFAQSAVLAATGTRIRIEGSLISNTWEFERKALDVRLRSGQAISLSGDASLELSRSALIDNAGAAVWAARDGGASVRITDSVVAAENREGGIGLSGLGTAAIGLMMWKGTLDIQNSLFSNFGDSALSLGEVTGKVKQVVVADSPIAFRLAGATQLTPTTDDQASPPSGTVLDYRTVLSNVEAERVTEAPPLGDCLCSLP
jgi:hypothetical protein